MALKIVVFYNQFAQGWTETYYQGGAGTPLTSLNNITKRQAAGLVSWRHSSVTLVAIRASVVGSPRVSYTRFFGGLDEAFSGSPVTPMLPDGGFQPADVTSTALIAALNSQPLSAVRHVAIRGLNDQDVVRGANGDSTPSAYLVTGVNLLIKVLMSQNWAIQTEVRPPTPGSVWVNATSVAPLNATQSVVLTLQAPALNLLANPQIVFQGVPRDDLPGFPRIATVIAQSNVAPFSITIGYRYRASDNPYIPAKLRFTSVLNDYSPITGWQLVDFNERKTGRAFGVPRGRARAVVRAQ